MNISKGECLLNAILWSGLFILQCGPLIVDLIRAPSAVRFTVLTPVLTVFFFLTCVIWWRRFFTYDKKH